MNRHLVETPEGVLHLRSAGPLEADRAVLFFHQSPASSRMWAGVMTHLADQGITCLAGDMFDYGMSDGQTHQLGLATHATLLWDAAQSLTSARLTVVGHHTGAVFAAACASHAPVAGLMVIGYPLYPSWRAKYLRLGARISPDFFSPDGAELAQLWEHLNRSFEPETSFATRYAILVDRLLAGPLWYTAYAALLAADLAAPLHAAAQSGIPLKTVFAKNDPLSRLEPEVLAITGGKPTRIEGGPWVTVEHPARVARLVSTFLEES